MLSAEVCTLPSALLFRTTVSESLLASVTRKQNTVELVQEKCMESWHQEQR